jgi:natural product precursor
MKSLKLNVLASENLSKVEMNQVKGGNSCTCGCQGPSSTEDNMNANYNGNKQATTKKVQGRKWDITNS